MKKHDIAILADLNDPEDFDVTHESVEVASRSRKIRIARHKSGLTQKKFAERFSIATETLKAWEQARETPPLCAVKYIQLCTNHPEIVLQLFRNAVVV